MKNAQPFWEDGQLELEFRQIDYLYRFKDAPTMSNIIEGACFGICAEAMRKSGRIDESGQPFSPEKALMGTLHKLGIVQNKEHFTAQEAQKAFSTAQRIHSQQEYLQRYLDAKPVQPPAVTVQSLNTYLDNDGVADIVLKGHALYVLKSDAGDNLFRVFDPNFGVSVPMNIKDIESQINAINKFYKYKTPPKIGSLSTADKSEIKYLQKGAPKHCAKPNHVVRMLEGTSPINPHVHPDFDYKKLKEDLGEAFVLSIAVEYMLSKGVENDILALNRFRELSNGEVDFDKFCKDLKLEDKHQAALYIFADRHMQGEVLTKQDVQILKATSNKLGLGVIELLDLKDDSGRTPVQLALNNGEFELAVELSALRTRAEHSVQKANEKKDAKMNQLMSSIEAPATENLMNSSFVVPEDQKTPKCSAKAKIAIEEMIGRAEDGKGATNEIGRD